MAKKPTQQLTEEQTKALSAALSKQSAEAKEVLGKAKGVLVLEQPFIASLLINMPMVERWDIPTMATEGTKYMYNPSFVMSLSMDEVRFVLAHEVMHCVHQHMFRRGDRDHRRWNQAADYVINDLLVSEKIGTMPKGGLHNPALVQSAQGTSDGVYNLLPESKDEGGKGDVGDPLDDCEDAKGDASERAAAESEMKVRVSQAAQAAKMCGKLSAGLARFADACLRPKVSWKDVTRRFWNSKARVDYTFARPKRRFIDQDLYLPTLTGEQLGEVVVFIDCSGSIDENTLNQFASEIKILREDCMPFRLHTVYFDSRVSHHDVFERDDALHIEAHGGGGTAFSPLWDFVENKGIQPVCGIVLTDLCCDDFGTPPDYPVLWVSTCRGEAPFGEVVLMDDRR